MCPHTNYIDNFCSLINFIDKAMLLINASGVTALEFAAKLFIFGRVLKWIPLKYGEKSLEFFSESCRSDRGGILSGLPTEFYFPGHSYPSSVSSILRISSIETRSSGGSFEASSIESTMPGIEDRYSVS